MHSVIDSAFYRLQPQISVVLNPNEELQTVSTHITNKPHISPQRSIGYFTHSHLYISIIPLRMMQISVQRYEANEVQETRRACTQVVIRTRNNQIEKKIV